MIVIKVKQVRLPKYLNQKKSNLHYTRRITPKRVSSCGTHLRGLAPGQHNSEESSQRRRVIESQRWRRHCVDLTGPGIEPQTSRTDSVRLATELTAGPLNTYVYTFHYVKKGSVLYFDRVFFVIFKPQLGHCLLHVTLISKTKVKSDKFCLPTFRFLQIHERHSIIIQQINVTTRLQN